MVTIVHDPFERRRIALAIKAQLELLYPDAPVVRPGLRGPREVRGGVALCTSAGAGRRVVGLDGARVIAFTDRAGAVRRGATAHVDQYVATTAAARDGLADEGVAAPLLRPPVAAAEVPRRPRGDSVLLHSHFPHASRARNAVLAANTLGLRVDVVGDGPDRRAVVDIAGPTVRFHRDPSEGELEALLGRAGTVVVLDDEGHLPSAVAAVAAGRPVVALPGSEAAEVVEDRVTGVLLPQSRPCDVGGALRIAQTTVWDGEAFTRGAGRFGGSAFRQAVQALVAHEQPVVHAS